MAAAREKVSIWAGKKGKKGGGVPPKFPPDPLDVADGWQRLVLVRYFEPDPQAPGDKTRGQWKVSYARYGSNNDGMAALTIVSDAMPMLCGIAQREVLEMLQTAGQRVLEAEGRASNAPTPLFPERMSRE